MDQRILLGEIGSEPLKRLGHRNDRVDGATGCHDLLHVCRLFLRFGELTGRAVSSAGDNRKTGNRSNGGKNGTEHERIHARMEGK